MSHSRTPSVLLSSSSSYTASPDLSDDNSSISSVNSRFSRFSSTSSNYSYRSSSSNKQQSAYRSDTDLIETPHGKHTIKELLAMRILKTQPEIFVSNFPITDSKTLVSKAYFGQFGAIKNIRFFKRGNQEIKDTFYIEFTTRAAAKDAIDHCNHNKWDFNVNKASAQWSTIKYCSYFVRNGVCKFASMGTCLYHNEWAKPWQILDKNAYKRMRCAAIESDHESKVSHVSHNIRALLKELRTVKAERDNYKSQSIKLMQENAALRSENNTLKSAQNMDENKLQFAKLVQDTCSTRHLPNYLASYLFE